MSTKFKNIIICLLFASFLIMPALTLAEGNLGTAIKGLDTAADKAGVKDKASISDLIGTVISIALGFVGLIFLVLMVYAGFLWMTARGEEEKVKTAQKIITACMIGLFVVLSAYAITFLITTRISSTQ